MGVDRADRDEQLLADLLVRVAEREQAEHVAFAVRERLQRGGVVSDDELGAEIVGLEGTRLDDRDSRRLDDSSRRRTPTQVGAPRSRRRFGAQQDSVRSDRWSR
jgi:hypothetical protein